MRSNVEVELDPIPEHDTQETSGSRQGSGTSQNSSRDTMSLLRTSVAIVAPAAISLTIMALATIGLLKL